MSRRNGKVETDEYAAMVQRMIRGYAKRVADGDWSDLEAMAAVQAAMDKAMGEAVRGMRQRYGYSWQDVGRGLGITRQAAQQRFGRGHPQDEV